MDEIWKDIPQYEGYYQVSNLGRVKRLDRIIEDSNGRKRFIKEKLRKPSLMGNVNSLRYGLTLSINKKVKRYFVHQLVAMAFLGHKPNRNNIVVDHIDNNPLNNKLSNLQLISHGANIAKAAEFRGKTSLFRGVCAHKNGKWTAAITVNGDRIYLGMYSEEGKANKAVQDYMNKHNIK